MASEDRLPEITRWLAAEGVGLYHLAARRPSLEEIFLEVIGDAPRRRVRPAGDAGADLTSWLRGVATVARLTFTEARRRRILAAALLLGAAFVVLFGIGLHFMARDIRAHAPPAQQALFLNLLTLTALYAANFLIVMTSVLVTVDTLAGEIGSGVIETLCTKPVPRAAVALGKWLGCWLILVLYALRAVRGRPRGGASRGRAPRRRTRAGGWRSSSSRARSS